MVILFGVMEWEIEETENDTFDVTQGNRPVSYDELTYEEAVDVVRRNEGQTFTYVELDGYRTSKEII